MSEGFESWMTKHRVRSTAMLGIGLWMSVDSYLWAKGYAASSTRNGVEIAGIIAAVQGLATFFTGWAFKVYCENKVP